MSMLVLLICWRVQAVENALAVSGDEVCRQIAYHAASDFTSFDIIKLTYSESCLYALIHACTTAYVQHSNAWGPDGSSLDFRNDSSASVMRRYCCHYCSADWNCSLRTACSNVAFHLEASEYQLARSSCCSLSVMSVLCSCFLANRLEH